MGNQSGEHIACVYFEVVRLDLDSSPQSTETGTGVETGWHTRFCHGFRKLYLRLVHGFMSQYRGTVRGCVARLHCEESVVTEFYVSHMKNMTLRVSGRTGAKSMTRSSAAEPEAIDPSSEIMSPRA